MLADKNEFFDLFVEFRLIPHSHESGNPVTPVISFICMDSRFRGNEESLVFYRYFKDSGRLTPLLFLTLTFRL